MRRPYDIPTDTKASNWFADGDSFRKLCEEAQRQAGTGVAMKFAATLAVKALQYGNDVYLSHKQLSWLCTLANQQMPPRITR